MTVGGAPLMGAAGGCGAMWVIDTEEQAEVRVVVVDEGRESRRILQRTRHEQNTLISVWGLRQRARRGRDRGWSA